jgi:hypothetical protein
MVPSVMERGTGPRGVIGTPRVGVSARASARESFESVGEPAQTSRVRGITPQRGGAPV